MNGSGPRGSCKRFLHGLFEEVLARGSCKSLYSMHKPLFLNLKEVLAACTNLLHEPKPWGSCMQPPFIKGLHARTSEGGGTNA